MDEIWKDIPGYEGKYQASNMGRIKSLSRKVRGRNWMSGKEFWRTIPECILRPGRYTRFGHVSVVLGHGTPGKPVHQLVLRTFVGEPPEGMEVLHINGDPTDNRLENLRYGTRSENIRDTYVQHRGCNKLSDDEVVFIKFALMNGFPASQLADEFGVSTSSIYAIKTGERYRWVE